MELFNKFFLINDKKFKSYGYYSTLVIITFIFSPLFLAFIFGDLNFLPLGPNESSHLNVAKSVYNGIPPYIEHFDARGPIFFYFLSLSFFFQNFLVGFHILYFVITFISGLTCFIICEKLYGKNSALFAFVASVFLLNQSQHAENLIFLFLSGFIYFAFQSIKEESYINPFFSGVFMSLAVLTRFNISILAILGLIYFLTESKKKYQQTFVYILSGLLPLLIILFIYYLHDNGLQIFYNSTVIYHLNLTQGRPFYIGIYQLLELLSTMPWISIFVLSIFAIFFHKKINSKNLYLFLFLIASIFATLLARKYNPHYLLVSGPFLVVLCSSIIDKKILQNNKLISIIFLITLIPLLISNIFWKAKYFYKPQNFSYFLSNILKSQINEKDKIFTPINGVYLYLNKKNFLRIVDDSHFNRWYNYESIYGYKVSFLDEFKFALIQKPKYLIFDKNFRDQDFFRDVMKLIGQDYEIYDFYNKDTLIYRGNYRNLINSTVVYIYDDK